MKTKGTEKNHRLRVIFSNDMIQYCRARVIYPFVFYFHIKKKYNCIDLYLITKPNQDIKIYTTLKSVPDTNGYKCQKKNTLQK